MSGGPFLALYPGRLRDLRIELSRNCFSVAGISGVKTGSAAATLPKTDSYLCTI